MTQKPLKKTLSQLQQTANNSNTGTYVDIEENPSLSTKALKSNFKGFFVAVKPNVTALTQKIRLIDKGGDLSKSWIITYYIYSNKHKKEVRKFIRIPAKYKTEKQRRDYAAEAIKWLQDQLAEGKTLDDNVVDTPVVGMPITFEKAIKDICDYKRSLTRRKETHISYNFFEKMILDFAQEYHIHLLKEFGVEQVYLFVKQWKKDISNRTYNNYLMYFKSMFNALVKRELIAKNPFLAMDKKTVTDAPNVPFLVHQKTEILSHIAEHSTREHLWFIKFIYYSLMRPVEITRIKIVHIQADKILVAGKNAKNSKTNYIIITQGMRALLDEMQLDQKPKNGYLFGRKGVGDSVQMADNYISRIHTPILRKLGYDETYTLYSWKDTGACDLYNATKDIVFVSRMCRHTNIDMTMKYLRSMGLLTDYVNAAKAPLLP